MANKLTSCTIDGKECFVDLSENKFYEDKGGLRRMSNIQSTDDESNDMLADYAAEYGRVIQSQQLMRASDRDGQLVRMDLTPGDLHTPAAMPNYAAGYKLSEGVADVACPVVNVQKTSNKFNTWSSDDAFQLPGDTEASPGGAVNEISPRLSQDNYQTVERALGSFVSTQAQANQDAPLNLAQAAVRRVMSAMALSREVRVATLLRTPGNYDSTLQVALDATTKWNDGPASNPLKNLQDMMEASYAPITRFIISERVRNAMVRNKAMLQYYANKSGVKAVPAMSELLSMFDLPPITVARMKYKATSTGLTYVWGGDVVGIVEPEVNPPTDQESIATAYTFRANTGGTTDGSFSGGYLVRQFFDQKRGTKGGTMVIVVSADAEKMTSSKAGCIITGAWQ